MAAQDNLPKIGELIEKAIRPLEQRRGIEAFRANLMDASFRIRSGSLHEFREVEVILVCSSRVSARTLPRLLDLILIKFSGVPNHPNSLRGFKIS